MEQGAPVCTWRIKSTTKEIWNFNFATFLDLLPEFDSNLFEFGFGLFGVGLNHSISA
jgi:hypothetical protein